MKSLTIGLLVLVAAVCASLIFLKRNRHAVEPVVVDRALSESSAPPSASRSDTAEAPKIEKPLDQPVVPAPTNNNPAQTENVASPAAGNELADVIARLVSPTTTYGEKQALLNKLREAGKLDEAIEALQKGAAANPGVAQYPTTIGEAILQKLAVLSRQGAPVNQMGMLGMQADMNFDSALKLEPENWEAQFYKAVAMAHWPLELNKSDEVVSRFSTLIDQQERSVTRPEYANTYVLLGDYFQKLGQADRAAGTWQLGIEKFPTDPTLRRKLVNN